MKTFCIEIPKNVKILNFEKILLIEKFPSKIQAEKVPPSLIVHSPLKMQEIHSSLKREGSGTAYPMRTNSLFFYRKKKLNEVPLGFVVDRSLHKEESFSLPPLSTDTLEKKNSSLIDYLQALFFFPSLMKIQVLDEKAKRQSPLKLKDKETFSPNYAKQNKKNKRLREHPAFSMHKNYVEENNLTKRSADFNSKCELNFDERTKNSPREPFTKEGLPSMFLQELAKVHSPLNMEANSLVNFSEERSSNLNPHLRVMETSKATSLISIENSDSSNYVFEKTHQKTLIFQSVLGSTFLNLSKLKSSFFSLKGHSGSKMQVNSTSLMQVSEELESSNRNLPDSSDKVEFVEGKRNSKVTSTSKMLMDLPSSSQEKIVEKSWTKDSIFSKKMNAEKTCSLCKKTQCLSVSEKSSQTLLQNKIKGVSQGFLIYLQISGVGYRATLRHQILQLNIGFSHMVFFEFPVSVKVFLLKPTLLCLYGLDKNQLTQLSHKIFQVKPPSAYTGKGFFLSSSFIDKTIIKKQLKLTKQGKRK